MNLSLLVRGVKVTAEKNIRIYYNKAPVMIFGLLFPLFMFLAFFLGRDIELALFFPGFIAMTLFFTSSSIGPLITPWEKQAGTYERLLSFPVSVETILLGDMLAGAIFGIAITLVVFIGAMLLLDIAVSNGMLLLLSMVIGTSCFASLGVLIASPSSRSPANIMMFSSLIRFPLIFISGVFIPFTQLEGTGKMLAYISPLTYLVDLSNKGLGNPSAFSISIDIAVLTAFTIVFLATANRFHKKNLMKGI